MEGVCGGGGESEEGAGWSVGGAGNNVEEGVMDGEAGDVGEAGDGGVASDSTGTGDGSGCAEITGCSGEVGCAVVSLRE